MRRLAGALVLAAGLAIVGSVVVVAAIPDAGGVIHGCYASKGGELRLINAPAASCSSKETAISWSQTGPPGPQGAPGGAGAAGPPGPQGPGGISGYQMFSLSFLLLPGSSQAFACPNGKKVLGGGVTLNYPESMAQLEGNRPAADGGGWVINTAPNSTGEATLGVVVFACADVGP